jgi:hypothetical protein
MAEIGTVKIRWRASWIPSLFRPHFKVLIDGEQVGIIGVDERYSFCLTAGSHQLRFDDSWGWTMAKLDIDVAANQSIELECGVRKLWQCVSCLPLAACLNLSLWLKESALVLFLLTLVWTVRSGGTYYLKLITGNSTTFN